MQGGGAGHRDALGRGALHRGRQPGELALLEKIPEVPVEMLGRGGPVGPVEIPVIGRAAQPVQRGGLHGLHGVEEAMIGVHLQQLHVVAPGGVAARHFHVDDLVVDAVDDPGLASDLGRGRMTPRAGHELPVHRRGDARPVGDREAALALPPFEPAFAEERGPALATEARTQQQQPLDPARVAPPSAPLGSRPCSSR